MKTQHHPKRRGKAARGGWGEGGREEEEGEITTPKAEESSTLSKQEEPYGSRAMAMCSDKSGMVRTPQHNCILIHKYVLHEYIVYYVFPACVAQMQQQQANSKASSKP